MKFVVFACALLVAGATAYPQNINNEIEAKEPRVVANVIRNIIRQVQNAIRENGLDPLIIDNFDFEYTIPFLVDVKIFLDNLSFIGASDIAIRQLDYSMVFNRLRFNIEFPQLLLVVVNSGLKANVLGEKYSAEFRGSLAFNGIGLSGDVRVNIGIISGITIRDMELKFRHDRIAANLHLVALGNDWSDDANNLFNKHIPYLLKTYEESINQFITDTVRAIVEEALKPSYLPYYEAYYNDMTIEN